jgi:hypothetical protein
MPQKIEITGAKAKRIKSEGADNSDAGRDEKAQKKASVDLRSRIANINQMVEEETSANRSMYQRVLKDGALADALQQSRVKKARLRRDLENLMTRIAEVELQLQHLKQMHESQEQALQLFAQEDEELALQLQQHRLPDDQARNVAEVGARRLKMQREIKSHLEVLQKQVIITDALKKDVHDASTVR